MDIYPTLLDIVGVRMPGQPPLDGISLVPLFEGRMRERPKPLGFMLWNGKGKFDPVDFVDGTQGVFIDGKYKLIVAPKDAAGQEAPVRLHDILEDPAHKDNLSEKLPDVVQRMRAALDEWRRSVRGSFDGKDYPAKVE
jgi:arylsulfatase A-like enzyme